MKLRIINHQHYKVFLEPYEDIYIIHCDVFVWNKHIKKSLLSDLDSFFLIHRSPVLAVHNGDEKHLKFLTMCKFKLYNTIECTDGVVRQLFVRY